MRTAEVTECVHISLLAASDLWWSQLQHMPCRYGAGQDVQDLSKRVADVGICDLLP